MGGGGLGENAPVRGSAPHTCPQSEEKMAKISHFRQIFGFLPPQNRILPPRCPPTKKFLRCRHWTCCNVFINLWALHNKNKSWALTWDGSRFIRRTCMKYPQNVELLITNWFLGRLFHFLPFCFCFVFVCFVLFCFLFCCCCCFFPLFLFLLFSFFLFFLAEYWGGPCHPACYAPLSWYVLNQQQKRNKQTNRQKETTTVVNL